MSVLASARRTAGRNASSPQAFEQLALGIDAFRRPLMAVAPEQGLPGEPRELRLLVLQEFGEVERLCRQTLCVLVVRQQPRQLVLEDGHAARLHADDGHAGANLVPEPID